MFSNEATLQRSLSVGKSAVIRRFCGLAHIRFLQKSVNKVVLHSAPQQCCRVLQRALEPSFKYIQSTLDLVNFSVTPKWFTKSSFSLNQVSFASQTKIRQYPNCSLNQGFSLNRESLNQELTVYS